MTETISNRAINHVRHITHMFRHVPLYNSVHVGYTRVGEYVRRLFTDECVNVCVYLYNNDVGRGQSLIIIIIIGPLIERCNIGEVITRALNARKL